jgi:transcription antitermination factor NusG
MPNIRLKSSGKPIAAASQFGDPGTIPAVNTWSVAWTKSRAEKALAEFLEARKIRHFLPLVLKRRVYGRHVRESRLPLFPGYVFYDGDEISHSRLLESGKVAKTLHTSDQARLRTELKSIAIAVSKNPVFKDVAFETGGMPVKVVRGPFSGLEGEFARRKGKTVLIIKVTMLSRAIEIEIDETNVVRN